MGKSVKRSSIPEESLIVDNFGKADYSDTYKIELAFSDKSVDEMTADIFNSAQWVDNLMKLRDGIVKVFGLKTGCKNGIMAEQHYSVGSKIGYFTVSDRNENEIVMAENDTHLNFRTSVLVVKNTAKSSVYLSTVVHFNNRFGRLYFFFVKPFHCMIIKSILKKYVNENR